MGTIALSNIINVTLSGTPQGLGSFNTNSICLFTNETPLSSEPYIWATNAQEIINEYGTDSLTAKMGSALFTPSTNLRSGQGQVLVFPYSATNATGAKVVTKAITDTIITALKLVTNGALTVTVDSVDYTITGMDFSSISTVADIVTILSAKNLDCDIAVVETNKIEFKSRRYGLTESGIALKATVGSGTDIYGATYLDGASAVATAGTDATGTSLATALASAEEVGYFGGVLTTQFVEDATLKANATVIQGKDHVYFEAIQSLKDIAGVGAEIKSAQNGKTRLLAYSSNGAVGAKQAIATYATIACSTNYNGTDTCLTMNLKTLTGIEPDLNLNQTYITSAKTNGVDLYGSLEGLGIVLSNNNNGYTDDITAQLWCKKDLEVTGFNYLRLTNTKIPQTESGMTGLKNAYETVLQAGVKNGFIGQGIGWGDTTPIPFGNPEDFKRNIKENGYYIYSLPVSQQSQAERTARKAPLIQIAIKSAGAIHSSDVIVNVVA